jgi:hypothetical protein
MRGVWSMPRPAALPPEKTQYTLCRGLGEPQGQPGWVWKIYIYLLCDLILETSGVPPPSQHNVNLILEPLFWQPLNECASSWFASSHVALCSSLHSVFWNNWVELTDLQQEEHIMFVPCPTRMSCFIFSLVGFRPLTCSKFISVFSVVFATFWVGLSWSVTVMRLSSSSHSVWSFITATSHVLHFRLICDHVWFISWYISGISFCSVWVSRLLRIHSSFCSC